MRRRDFGISAIAGLLVGTSSRDARAGDSAGVSAQSPGGRTGFVFDEIYLRHVIQKGHPESPDRLRAIQREMAATGLDAKVTRIAPISDAMPHIRRIHTPEHIAAISAIPVTGKVAGNRAPGMRRAAVSGTLFDQADRADVPGPGRIVARPAARGGAFGRRLAVLVARDLHQDHLRPRGATTRRHHARPVLLMRFRCRSMTTGGIYRP